MNQTKRDDIIENMKIRGITLHDVFRFIKDFIGTDVVDEILEYYDNN